MFKRRIAFANANQAAISYEIILLVYASFSSSELTFKNKKTPVQPRY